MNKKEDQILNIIRAIRLSFLEAGIVYTNGACYGFYTILKAIYPNATAYATDDNQHIVTKIGKKYYDVQGEYICSSGNPIEGLSLLTKKQHGYWEAVISTQSVPYILKKKES